MLTASYHELRYQYSIDIQAEWLRERAEAAASKRESSATALLPSLSPPPESTSAGPLALISQPSSQSLAAGIDDLVAALKPRKAQQGGRENEDMAASVSGSLDQQASSSNSLLVCFYHISPGLPHV